jgi:hypothetical protein
MPLTEQLDEAVIERRRRQRPSRIRNTYEDAVPPVIEAYVTLVRKRIIEQIGETDGEQIVRALDDTFNVVPMSRAEFEQGFLEKRFSPAEVKFDEETDRVYVVGLGLPGREELKLQDRPIKNKHGDIVARDLATVSENKHDIQLCYTEVTWADLRAAESKLEKMNQDMIQGLYTYFECSPYQLVGPLLALESHTNDDLERIARYALYHNRS